ncbi:MAG TPA: DUF6600 domain-containing protein [Candidatus Acidoferrales bacterium]|nr:DUF6600 domain-containing protein [Candidatus Acidoferrales bacterium]
MRRIVSSLSFFSLSILLLAALSPAAHAADYSYARIVRLSYVSGDVQINRDGHSNWEQAVANMPVEQGFTIGTNDGRAEIEFEDGATMWIAENTLVQFTELALSDGGRISHLTMAQGTVTASAKLKSADSFTIAAGQVKASPSTRALFRMDVYHDGASISVTGGSVLVESPAGMKMVPHGQTYAFNVKNADTAALRQNPKPDSWDRWASGRERSGQTSATEASYLVHAPFTYGLDDLAAYGNWNYFPGYGYGWQPVGMGCGWMPFMDGMWDFYPGLGWTWVSYEPWGWVPYHFGNWNYSPAFGWMWMPGDLNAWNPGPVDWYEAGNQIAWSPDMSNFGPSQMFLTGFGGWGGCGGFNNWQPAFVPLSRPQPGTKNGSGSGGGKILKGRHPVPPRFLLTAGKQLGGDSRVRVLTGDKRTTSVEALPVPPLANGKIARGAETGEMSAAQGSRVLVTTAANLNQLRGSMRASANGSAVAMMHLPSEPRPAAMPTPVPIRNGGLMPASMPHPPAPMRFTRADAGMGMRSGGFRGDGPMRGGSSSNGPSFSAPRSAPAAPASHASSGSGKPH